jgi:hypothetical protein
MIFMLISPGLIRFSSLPPPQSTAMDFNHQLCTFYNGVQLSTIIVITLTCKLEPLTSWWAYATLMNVPILKTFFWKREAIIRST